MSSKENTEDPDKSVKPKQLLTELQLETLRKAREKALIKRKELGEIKAKEKELKELN